ncbi:MAG: phenylacetate--CoA ligase family protein [Thiohalospira sp.]
MYERLFQRVLLPLRDRLRGGSTARWWREYERQQRWSPEELAELQWQKLWALLDHCQRRVPYYRETWAAAGVDVNDFTGVGDLRHLPTVDKAAIREHRDAFVAEGWQGELLYKQTGGSTGEPLDFGFTRESDQRRLAVMFRGYSWAGAPPGRRVAYLWGAPAANLTRRQRLREAAFHRFFNRRMFDINRMDPALLESLRRRLLRYRPRAIVGYVAPLQALADHALREGRALPQVDGVLAAAEQLYPAQRELIEEAFRSPVFNTYGCREFMLIASECEQGRMHLNSDHLVVEAVDGAGQPAPGGGDLAITDLHNFGFPFVRYRNGDQGLPGGAGCPCGRGLPVLERLDGRSLDVIRTPSGATIPGEYFFNVMRRVGGVRRFQVVQEALDRLEVRYVLGPEFTPAAQERIEAEIRRVLGGEAMEVIYRAMEELPTTASGKLRVTISRLGEGA